MNSIINFEELREKFNRFINSLFFFVVEEYDYCNYSCSMEIEEFAKGYDLEYEEIEEEEKSENDNDFVYVNDLYDLLYEVLDCWDEKEDVGSYNYYRKVIIDAFDLEEFTCDEVILKK